MQRPPIFDLDPPNPPVTEDESDLRHPESVPNVQTNEHGTTVPTTSREEALNIGREIATIMSEQGYHPIVVFGSASSGKSFVLASLLAYLRSNETGVQFLPGDPILPLRDDHARQSYEEAKSFFLHVDNFLQGRGQGATKITNPFFIPAILTPSAGRPVVKLAFLESNGEWYQRMQETDPPFRQLRGEIEGLMQSFQKGISFLHIAPCTQVVIGGDPHQSLDNDRKLQELADEALANCLASYATHRVAKHLDTHMLLVTKWDAYAKPGAPNGEFFCPALETVQRVAIERYPRGYAAFCNLNLESNLPWQRQIMQYSSGLIFDRAVQQPEPELRSQLGTYSRTLLNWLYGNATRTYQERVIDLWPQPPPPRLSLRERSNQALGKLLEFLGV